MYYTKYLLKILGFCATSIAIAQNDFETLSESEFLINHKVSSNYKINFALKSRAFFYRDSNFIYEPRQLDLVHFSTFALNFNQSISLGIQYRNRDWFDDSSNELRLTQQFNITKRYLSKRFGHRFRLEQRILDHVTIYRLRYRFALDFPLKGEKLDLREPYLVVSTELLNSMNKLSALEIDQRTTAQIGWQFSKGLKLQAGLENRFEAFNTKTEHKLFLLTSAILKI